LKRLRIAVIGARGFAGSYLAADAERRGHDVVPILSTSLLQDVTTDLAIDCNGDSRRFWAEENPEASFRANVLPVLDRALALKCRTYVFLSSIDVYGGGREDPAANVESAPITLAGMDPYGFQKYLAEQVVRYYFPRHLILRLGTLIGPGMRKNPVFDALHGHPIRQSADSTLPLLSLGALAEVIHRLIEGKAEGIFNVTGSRAISVHSMLKSVAEALRVSPDGFRFHENIMTRNYRIAIGKISKFLSIPDSETMLRDFLSERNG